LGSGSGATIPPPTGSSGAALGAAPPAGSVTDLPSATSAGRADSEGAGAGEARSSSCAVCDWLGGALASFGASEHAASAPHATTAANKIPFRRGGDSRRLASEYIAILPDPLAPRPHKIYDPLPSGATKSVVRRVETRGRRNLVLQAAPFVIMVAPLKR